MNKSSIAPLSPVVSAKPAAGYVGGKRNLAGRICKMIERIEHDGYAEPFVGMGGIFLRRRARPKAEVINDISGDVANLFRILQRHYQPFIDTMRWQLSSRAEFDRLMRMDPTTLTDLERAGRFLYLQRLTFGGKVAGRSFGVSSGQAARFNISTLEPQLAEIHERLAGVVIEQLSFDAFIRRYDRPGMLFYLDPPYWGCETDYGQDVFGRADFTRLAELLAGIRGQFLMSINDTPGARATFGQFAVTPIATTYSIGAGDTRGAGQSGELLITNVSGLTAA